MDLSQPRGIRDIEPDEFDLHLKIRRAFEEVARAYNFKLMEPGPSRASRYSGRRAGPRSTSRSTPSRTRPTATSGSVST